MNTSLDSVFDDLTTSKVNMSEIHIYNNTADNMDASGISTANLTTVLLGNEDYVLWILNEKLFVSRFLPATIYIGICAVLGSVGNGAVVCVYNSKRKRNTANVFIFFLGIVDFLLCAIVMPFKLFDMRYPLMYGIPALCKSYHFLEISMSMVAITFMVCIAVDRYLIIARPLNKMTLSRIYKIITLCVAIGIAASWPTLFVYGESTIRTQVPEIRGSTCGVTDVIKSTAIPQVWYMYLYAVFVITLLILICMYTKIWLMIRKWSNTLIGESAACFTPRYKRKFTNRYREPIPFGTGHRNVKINYYIPLRVLVSPVRHLSFDDEVISLRDTILNDDGNSSNSNSSQSSESKENDFQALFKFFRLFPRNRHRSTVSANSMESYSKKRARMRRNTIVFAVISVLFVLSYLPCLVVIGLRTLQLYNVTKANPLNARVAEVFIRSGYLSSVFNPFVYSFLCPNFRGGVYKLLFR